MKVLKHNFFLLRVCSTYSLPITNLIAGIGGVGLVGVGEGEGGEGGGWTAVQGHVLQQEPALRVHVLNIR